MANLNAKNEAVQKMFTRPTAPQAEPSGPRPGTLAHMLQPTQAEPTAPPSTPSTENGLARYFPPTAQPAPATATAPPSTEQPAPVGMADYDVQPDIESIMAGWDASNKENRRL